LEAVAKGEVCALLMAGGQGTRLGSADPKGCFGTLKTISVFATFLCKLWSFFFLQDIGLPSKRSIFNLHADRLLKLQQLAASAFPQEKNHSIPW